MFALGRLSLGSVPRLGVSSPFLRNSSRSIRTARSLFSTFSQSRYEARAAYANPSFHESSQRARTGLVIGIMGLSATYMVNHNPIKNDSAYYDQQLPPPPAGYGYVKVPEKPKYDGAFGGKLSYKELTLGSVFGLVSGLIVGQLSTVFVFIALGAYLAVQYLHAQGILTIPVTKIIRIGSEDIDVRKMVFDRPSFSITYILSFLVAAYNS
ncbi:DEKNAAC105244 [Brettanomyces naardenensis]|uniref:DEKNAAC105244 n=1 Tax=Brettanomyces naardenensis TaxID=13370 RepID=A0A448YSY1_BRENA|nr:DEKNAAC105244 [Brettanomyces naardenensis]